MDAFSLPAEMQVKAGFGLPIPWTDTCGWSAGLRCLVSVPAKFASAKCLHRRVATSSNAQAGRWASFLSARPCPLCEPPRMRHTEREAVSYTLCQRLRKLREIFLDAVLHVMMRYVWLTRLANISECRSLPSCVCNPPPRGALGLPS